MTRHKCQYGTKSIQCNYELSKYDSCHFKIQNIMSSTFLSELYSRRFSNTLIIIIVSKLKKPIIISLKIIYLTKQ